MSTTQIAEIAALVVLSLGGGGAIVFGLSSYLGKLWAQRLMAQETARHNQELERLRTTLAERLDRSSQNYRHKIDLYKEASNPLIALVAKAGVRNTLTKVDLHEFERTRLETTALLAMFAPSEIFDQYNGLVDYVYDVMEEKVQWSFPTFREKALRFLSSVRKDIGLHDDSVSYKGTR